MICQIASRLAGCFVVVGMLVAFPGCQTTQSSHKFADPSPAWSTKTGQLAYTDEKVSLIGEVLVRYSRQGEFELTFTKAGGITLLSLRQDASFGKVEGPLARRGWSGPTAEAPAALRGWFQLRDKIVNARKSTVVRHEAGAQTFTLRF
jgi:hypothetical protein